jgi:hypothetical protein
LKLCHTHPGLLHEESGGGVLSDAGDHLDVQAGLAARGGVVHAIVGIVLRGDAAALVEQVKI